MQKRPRYTRYWPRFREAVCPCGQRDETKLRFYIGGFRCTEHRPGA